MADTILIVLIRSAAADQLEKLVVKTAWPYPGYDDMLFVL
jgi:glutamine synthetase type III